ncbi:uncharacterized protein TNCV_37771 [Trichonephila clavipes]|nr:uncharacterized protein TNCV_37771 [Trichonephila clavipes]
MPELAPSLCKLAHHTNGRTLSHDREIYRASTPLHGGTSVALGLELMTEWSCVHDTVASFSFLRSSWPPSSHKSSREVGGRGWEAHAHPQSVLPQNWGETELNRSVPCMVLKAMAKDRRHLALCHDEFRGP